MRRCLILFLLVLLPLQFAWAGAASYCTHEQGKGVQHFGHHEHRHASTLAQITDDVSGDHQTNPHGDSDPDCGYCHFGCAQPLAVVLPAFVAPQPVEILAARPAAPPTSLLANTIERPNWARLAL